MKHLTFFLCLILGSFQSIQSSEFFYDVVIYGGSSSGVIAAVQAAQMGKSVALIEPKTHLGGITSNGLGWVDIFSHNIIGGLSREFFHRIWLHYQNDDSWIWEQKRLMRDQSGMQHSVEKTLWVFEPHVAENIFEQMIAEAKVQAYREERLDRKNGVIKKGNRIESIAMESGRIFHGRMFIDATYEGDLMAAAGVAYVVGREANSTYKETMNGIQSNLRRTEMPKKLDGYVVKGIPERGLLPRVHQSAGGKDGEADKGVQAYNFRMCLTDVPSNRIMIGKPKDYNEADYELVFRAIEAGIKKEKFFKLDLMPNRKTDSNNNGPISTDFIGMSWEYPEADYAKRKQIEQDHENWQKGLVWTLQNHSRIPLVVKEYYAPWGLPKDEFVDNNNWPHQLYVREARRMVSEVVITELIALGKGPAYDCIAVGSYHLDSHYIKYCIAPDGFLITDGGLFKKVPAAFPISYRSIIPFREQCENLLVPICLSATHVAYGSVRMEPVFMVIGQSAATAACLAIDHQCALQDLPYESLRQKLLSDQQVLK